jgi:hypothetical protein
MAGIFWLASYPKSGNACVRIFLGKLMELQLHPVEAAA